MPRDSKDWPPTGARHSLGEKAARFAGEAFDLVDLGNTKSKAGSA